MNTLTYKLQSASELLFGKPVFEKRRSDETHEQLEERTWHYKVRVNSDGTACISGMAIKQALEAAGSRLNMKLTGKQTYTKLFRQGVLIEGDIPLANASGKPITIDQVIPMSLFVSAKGQRGGDQRVMRVFPKVTEWNAIVTITVLDKRLTDDIVRQHLEEAGRFIGIGSMRVERGGIAGRFAVE